MSENGEIYTAGKNFTLLPAVTALTNITSDNKKTKKEQNEKDALLSGKVHVTLNMNRQKIKIKNF